MAGGTIYFGYQSIPVYRFGLTAILYIYIYRHTLIRTIIIIIYIYILAKKIYKFKVKKKKLSSKDINYIY